jgi:hypothetical protein
MAFALVSAEEFYGPFPEAYTNAIQASAIAISSQRPCEAVVILSDALTATDIDADVPQHLPSGEPYDLIRIASPVIVSFCPVRVDVLCIQCYTPSSVMLW